MSGHANNEDHGITEASRKGYCMLYFFMFLFLLFGAIYLAVHGNMNAVPGK
jgi:hypothetical protein